MCPREDLYNFRHSLVEREDSRDMAMITDQFVLNKPPMSQTTSEIGNLILCPMAYFKTFHR